MNLMRFYRIGAAVMVAMILVSLWGLSQVGLAAQVRRPTTGATS
ncbi:MAG: hypothetical protein ABIR11_01180 [Candidatus Limnocylindrales bacterium]